MSKQDILDKLSKKEIKNIFSRAGIQHLWLFGSFARWDNKADSDIDLLYDYDPKYDTSLGWVFSIRWNLKDILPYKIDLLSRESVSDDMKQHVFNSCIQIW